MRIPIANRNKVVEEYYFSRKLKEIAQMRQEGLDVINLGIGNPDLPPSAETIQSLVDNCQKHDVHGYQSYTGIPELRKAFAAWYKRFYKVDLNYETEILPLMGSKEGIMHISMAFLNTGDEVLIPDPGYPAYSAVTKLMEAKIVTYDLREENGWYPDLDELEKLDLSKVKIMWVNYPNMPTGSNATTDLFTRLVDFGLRNNILICNDNPYSFILNDRHLSILTVPGAMEIALELNSLSKSNNMAGWRIGMLAGNAGYLQAVLGVKSNMDSGMFRPLQMAAVEALNSDENWYTALNLQYNIRRAKVWELFDCLGCNYDRNQSGLFVWARIPESFKNAEELSGIILEKAHVFITPGFIFGKNGDQFLRISLCSSEETFAKAKQKIITAFNNIAFNNKSS